VIAVNTTIDLNISAYIPDEFFGSSLDKMNFYRELESVENSEDLGAVIQEFKQINSEFPATTQNLFDLLSLKFKAGEF
jgi:transcription-repair coupling factor (superfamily II helicase)